MFVPLTAHYIQNRIDALKGEVTVVIVAHRLSTVQNADRVYVLDEGRVIESGTYEELRRALGRRPSATALLPAREDGEFREMVEMQSL